MTGDPTERAVVRPRRLGRLGAPLDLDLSLRPLTGPISAVARTIPVVMVVVGFVVAGVGASASQRPETEGIGTMGVEVGAALWFGGAVVLGARRSATVLRALLLFVTALAGIAVVALALLAGWHGAALDLAMEFGVGAVAVAVIDILFLSIVQPRLEGLADRAETTRVTVRLGGPGPAVGLRAGSPDPEDPPR